MTKKTYPSDKLDQYIVRFPDGLRDRLKDEAKANKRSMNSEIIDRLERSFDFMFALAEEREGDGPPDNEPRLPRIAKALADAETLMRYVRTEMEDLAAEVSAAKDSTPE